MYYNHVFTCGLQTSPADTNSAGRSALLCAVSAKTRTRHPASTSESGDLEFSPAFRRDLVLDFKKWGPSDSATANEGGMGCFGWPHDFAIKVTLEVVKANNTNMFLTFNTPEKSPNRPSLVDSKIGVVPLSATAHEGLRAWGKSGVSRARRSDLPQAGVVEPHLTWRIPGSWRPMILGCFTTSEASSPCKSYH